MLKQGTKKAQSLIDSYNYAVERYGYRHLCNCYNTYSREKEYAEDWLLSTMNSDGGHGYTVMSYNTFGFTCGYLYPEKETGALILRVDTPKNTYETYYV